MDASKIHLGVVLGLEDLDEAGDLDDPDITHSDMVDHIVECIMALIQQNYMTSDGT